MSEQMKMIGRREEIETLERWIREPGTTRLVCIHGDGGIGKTRLLQEISKDFMKQLASVYPVADGSDLDDRYYLRGAQSQSSTTIRIPEIIDFDDRYYNVTSNLEVKIGHILRQYGSEDLQNEWLKLRWLELIGSKTDPYGQPEEQAHAEFLKYFNKVAEKHKIALLFDTIEAPGGPDISI